jgi:hypothetical protein
MEVSTEVFDTVQVRADGCLGVTLHSNPGITLICFQSLSGI